MKTFKTKIYEAIMPILQLLLLITLITLAFYSLFFSAKLVLEEFSSDRVEICAENGYSYDFEKGACIEKVYISKYGWEQKEIYIDFEKYKEENWK